MLERESVQRTVQELKKYITRQRLTVENLKLIDDQTTTDLLAGDYFGKKNTYYTIIGSINIPEDWQHLPLSLEIFTSDTEWDNATNPQMKVYLNDELIQALDVNHREVMLPEKFSGQAELDFRLELFSGREEKKFPLKIFLNQLDLLTRTAYFDFYVAVESWRAILGDSHLERIYQDVLKRACHALDFRTPYSDNYYAGLTKARKIMTEDLYDVSFGENYGTVYAVGHTHIDIAWLWTVRQAIEKGERSFATVLKLMRDYPDYTFLQSQPQLYVFIKENYPELYAQIKQKISEGRWQPEGAMWVEADCNLTSGESLVRQIMYGKKFFKEEFGYDSQILWLPDVFGYSAALPQILKKTNTPYFMTTKLSWNQFNQIPYDTFYWKGIDGSEVLTHFITTISEGYSPTPYYTTYNGILDPFTIKGSWERYLQKDINDEILIAYGYGDGGGGPTIEMLETAERLKQGLPGIPKVVPSSGVDFFRRLEKRLDDKPMPRWMGELYFEYHRGTYTSIAKNKKHNRMAETLLQSIEKLSVVLGTADYPAAVLDKLWQLTLLNQFHDTLPGSSIKEVYDQTDLEYADIFSQGSQLVTQAVAEQVVPGEERQLFLFNPLGFERTVKAVVPLAENTMIYDGDKPLKQQRTSEGHVLFEVPSMPGLSSKLLILRESKETGTDQLSRLGRTFESTHYTVAFNDVYEITSLFDKQNKRELVPHGEALNVLNVYEDLPLNFDAWDIDSYYREKVWPIREVTKAEMIEDGLVRQTILLERRFESSTLRQKIHFYHNSRRIDFETDVDWHQQHLLLKAEFPLDIHTYKATFDIQFGNVERNIHQNTSWDQARFEVCGQKWIDLSEGGYGVSLMSDCKYGFNAAYQKIGISLIKSATDPHPEADQGHHTFTYSLLPHCGSWQEAETMEEALDLNTPALTVPFAGEFLQPLDSSSWLAADAGHVVIDSVKKAEADSGVVVRLYEYKNRRGTVTFRLKEPFAKIVLCDLLENEREVICSSPAQEFELTFNPYDIHTIKLIKERHEESQ